MARATFLLGAAATVVLLVGCDGTNELIGPAGQPQSIASESDGLRLTLQTNQPEYAPDEPVELTFEVKNTSDASRTFEFSDGCQHDFLARHDGELVWNLGHGRGCIEMLTSFKLAPGETWTRSNVWDQRSNKGEPVSPGAYDLTGVLTQTPTPLESDTLRIVIR